MHFKIQFSYCFSLSFSAISEELYLHEGPYYLLFSCTWITCYKQSSLLCVILEKKILAKSGFDISAHLYFQLHTVWWRRETQGSIQPEYFDSLSKL